MTDRRLLLLFVRNPELGKVKTRLATTIGPEKALEVYLHLLQHTRHVTQCLPVDKRVYYTDRVAENDLWPEAEYQKRLQAEGDLGHKMEAAFAAAFAEGYTSVVIIGSDCLQLTQEIVQQAFDKLQARDVVMGPAEDGGYYLLGMKKLYPAFFRNKQWSTAEVFPATLQDIEHLHLTCALLPCLSDVDYVEDLGTDFGLNFSL
ncbi:TIGR04282 family arsenosugar biosynthesis glycosyltransferase [Pontibacter sp. 172403-2]|uniref:TIGR04282 family arsenosugar biosynthesis glycosyltransferase n=1 Tax=Pontibacter rufus TaxID=2791028 RepID=UPI0018AF974A|nr:TIGR04282 family arsenosugar biosynthesis glycosyltransferase [Pontibacter sp. 172403-2]MBF9254187.1 TIGR04282 family arsenosugar biosynthesis glycosyltransferase [Pontibacter sp. 172403-2]